MRGGSAAGGVGVTAPTHEHTCVEVGRLKGQVESLRRANLAFAAENARLRLDLGALHDVADAADEWRRHYGNTSDAFAEACTRLVAAVDALPKQAAV